MTIPVIPGPFSFLAGAGRAAGAVGTEIEKVKERRRQEAQQNVQNLLALIDAGRVSPDTLNRPEVISQFQAAGIPIPQQAKINASVPGIAMNVPVNVETPPPFGESADDVVRRITKQYLGTVQPGTPQAAAVAKVPTAATAAAAERTAVAGAGEAESKAIITGEQARAAPAGANADIARSDANKAIYQGVLTTFGKDPQFARLAEEAAAGILQDRIAGYQINRYGLSESRQREHDQAVMIGNMVNDIDNSYNAELKKWEDGAQQAINDAITLGGLKPKDITDPAKTMPFIQAYTARFPKPTPEQARDRYLASHHIKVEDFQRALTRIAPVLLGEEPPAAGGGDKGRGGRQTTTPPPTLTPDQVLQRAAARLSAPRPKPDGSMPTAQELISALDAYHFTNDQLTRLLNLVRTRSNDPQLIQLLTTKIHGGTNE